MSDEYYSPEGEYLRRVLDRRHAQREAAAAGWWSRRHAIARLCELEESDGLDEVAQRWARELLRTEIAEEAAAEAVLQAGDDELLHPLLTAAAAEQIARENVGRVKLVVDDPTIYLAATSSIDEGLIAGRALLADLSNRPTAVLAQSDLLAAGVIRAAEEAGLGVPEDLSVAGFDGIRVDGIGPHVLTTMVQPAVEKGRAAGEQVARMLRGEQAGSRQLTSRFRAGTTTARVPADA